MTTSPVQLPEPEEVNAYQAGEPGTPAVVITPEEFRLPGVLRHIEAGKTVIVVPAPRRPPPAD